MSKERIFLRGLSAREYGLKGFREAQLAAPRVVGARHDLHGQGNTVGYTHGSDASWRLGPGDDPFLTQTIQVHFVEVPPGGSNQGHGHQNEAAFYILQGRGHEIHDDQRYDWCKDDLVYVHTDSVHRHFNDGDEPAIALVMKAKSMWMYFGLVQQGRSGPIADEDAYGPREDWSQVWTPQVLTKKKVITPADTRWEDTPDGRVRVIAAPDLTGQRIFSVDVFEQEIAPGARSGRRWQMADEVLYVLEGSGTSLQWHVEADIAERFYARIALEPTAHEFTAGDTVYVPQNHVRQFVATGDRPLRLLSAQNRLFRSLGYDNTVQLESASDPAAGEQLPVELNRAE